MAALLAAAGFPAIGEVFQGAAGFFQTFYQREGDYDTLLDQLGSRFELVVVGPKPFPSCRYTHCAVTGCLDLLRKHSIKASDIEEVRVQIGERDMRSVGGWSEDEKKKKHRPEGVVDAQFSIPYTVAATLLSGGLPLVLALETAGSSIESKLLSNAVLQSVQKVREGRPLSQSLEETGIFPELSFEMIEVGESTGALPAMLTSVAEFLEEDVQTALSAALSLIEPVILIVMGFVVATVLIALYLPIFSLGAQAGGA